MKVETDPSLYGLAAEFVEADAVVEAARRVHAEGYRRVEAYSPYPVEGLSEALGFRRNALPWVVLIGGLVGGFAGYFMQWYSATIHYPLNIGGRPNHSWPSFIPITFELTILFASLSAVFGMLGLNGLPRPYHPLFNVQRFELASRNRFFIGIMADDPKFDLEGTRKMLEGFGAAGVYEVPA